MLRHLSIKDFAVVRATELEFGPGMTVVSGETGAGKSLMVDALGFLSGLRADSGVVRHGADRAELSAEFQLPAEHPGLTWLADNELDDDAQCQLRRIIRADGGSRAWINGRPVTSSQLSDLAARLVEIHGQHEHQALMARNSQLALLDAYARNSAQREQVRQASQRWQALLDERDALSAQGDVSDRIGFLEHQLAELEREDLDPAAIAALDTNHRRQAHATALIGACESVVQQLNGDEGPSALGLLQDSRHDLARVAEHEPRLGEVDALLDSAAIQIEEALALLDRVRDDLDADPTQFEAMERRLGRLHDLARKHRVSPDELAAHRDHLTAEVESLRGADERLQQLDKHIEAAIGVWQGAASVLSASRQSAAQALSAATTTLIGELGMGGGQFLIQLQPQETLRPDPNGAERVEFLVAANAGQPPRALRKVASGGELSRISLAIEVAALGLDSVPTMVFDEVDSGIGGAVADIVGQKLRALGEERQVLCVTHLPQVAAKGHAHYRVSKAPVDGMTQSAVELLGPQARQEELARMLGGVEVSKEARAAARKLLQSA
ncbi:DNA repair protein RecN [Xanthomonas campestris pv. campestris]|jgi:DNA repair protein RecN (Recombination protein N)|uniref:DNA repair protein RecN n=1 Tax=Xanthomonas campestris pv. campestris (strain ATCC 33913 / DSM 3586 / NCPPB 528 / LMG 568 / P 25) TaxID=190485 RepID=Q8PAL2_XANCP|nr:MULTISPECIES: DNA repair protein RecN [Xanthomonas]AAM40767.1 recombination protein N [Xanthomonas campestris pv. campestris str. ATCC 33913]MCC5066723.1 DNA repair protein RecN [Xanthomonas campestris]MCC5076295.1 DNA repair protein RecN [Xanthomonas campestris pv. campestris]MCC5084001.1 DNA repair protein RecN [Xanthomonas campestris]MCC8487202.1 DNA repair protein RecN [Xanthomonas campestris]